MRADEEIPELCRRGRARRILATAAPHRDRGGLSPHLPRVPRSRSADDDAAYSERSAITGSIRDARHAGSAVASNVTIVNSAITDASVSGSAGDIPNSTLRIVKPTPTPPASPIARPIASRRADPAPPADHVPARAPSAMRVPNSAVRCATAYDTTPNRPVVASSNATSANPREHPDDHVVARRRLRRAHRRTSAGSRSAPPARCAATRCALRWRALRDRCPYDDKRSGAPADRAAPRPAPAAPRCDRYWRRRSTRRSTRASHHAIALRSCDAAGRSRARRRRNSARAVVSRDHRHVRAPSVHHVAGQQAAARASAGIVRWPPVTTAVGLASSGIGHGAVDRDRAAGRDRRASATR